MQIGVVGYKTERGLYYLSQLFQHALSTFSSVQVLSNPLNEHYPVFEFVSEWVDSNKLDVIISFESNAKSSLGILNLLKVKECFGTKLIEVPMVDCFGHKWLESRGLDGFDAIICVSQFAYNLFTSYSYNKAVLIRPGFKRVDKIQTTTDELVYLHPSGSGGVKHVKRKNSLEVLQAFVEATKIRKDIRLLFYSQLSMPKFLDFYSNDKGLINEILQYPQVTYNFGHLDREQFIALYNSTDVLCYPTKKEGLGLCFFEAACYGIPAIVMNMTPYNEFIESGNGWLCRAVEQKQWRDFFVKLHFVDIPYLTNLFVTITKEDVLEKRAAVCRLIDDLYNWDSFILNLQQLISRVV